MNDRDVPTPHDPDAADDPLDAIGAVFDREEVPMLPPPPGRWDQIAREGRRRERNRRVGYGALAAAAAVAVVVLGLSLTGGPGDTADTIPAAPTTPTTPTTPTPSTTPAPTTGEPTDDPSDSVRAPAPATTDGPVASTDPDETVASDPGTSPAVDPGTDSGPADVDVVPCLAAGLSGALGEVSAAASTRSVDILLTNTSDTPCTILGFGGLALTDESGAPLPTAVRRTDEDAEQFTLEPGQVAAKRISWRVVPDDQVVANCIDAAGMIVTPPDETRQVTIDDVGITACNSGQIDGGPFVPVP